MVAASVIEYRNTEDFKKANIQLFISGVHLGKLMKTLLIKHPPFGVS